MTPEQALTKLRGRPVVPVTRGSLQSIKDLHADCLRRDIPATMRRPCGPGGG